MRFKDDIYLIATEQGYDDDFNPIETRVESHLAHCAIRHSRNNQVVTTQDGTAFSATYEVTAHQLAQHIARGQLVRIVKADGSIDATLPIIDFDTAKRFAQIWL
jgi:hypothetical protein